MGFSTVRFHSKTMSAVYTCDASSQTMQALSSTAVGRMDAAPAEVALSIFPSESSPCLKRAGPPWRPRSRSSNHECCEKAGLQRTSSTSSESSVASTAATLLGRTESVSSDFSTMSSVSESSRRVCVNYLDEPGRVEIYEFERYDSSSICDWAAAAHRLHLAKLGRRHRCRGEMCSKPDALNFAKSSNQVQSNSKRVASGQDRKCFHFR